MFVIRYIRYNRANKPESIVELQETKDAVKSRLAKLLSVSGYQRELNKLPTNKRGIIEEIAVYTLNPQNELTDWGISNKEEFENLGIEECKKYNLKYKSAINNDIY